MDIQHFANGLTKMKSAATLDYLNQLGQQYFKQTQLSIESMFGLSLLHDSVMQKIYQECQTKRHVVMGHFTLHNITFNQDSPDPFPLSILNTETWELLENLVEQYLSFHNNNPVGQFRQAFHNWLQTLNFNEIRQSVVKEDNYDGFYKMGFTSTVYHQLYPMMVVNKTFFEHPFFMETFCQHLISAELGSSPHLAHIKKIELLNLLRFEYTDWQLWLRKNHIITPDNEQYVAQIHQLQHDCLQAIRISKK